MEREPYRRVTPRRGAKVARSGGFKETLIVQGIVSGLVLAAVMLSCLAENDAAVFVRENIAYALEGQTTFDGLLGDVLQGFGQTREAEITMDEPLKSTVPEPLPFPEP